MKAFKDFEKAKSDTTIEGISSLPEGGYICRILDVNYHEPRDGKSGMLDVLIDVVEGDYKDFFKSKYENNTFDDKTWKGKTVIWEPNDDGSEKDEWTKRKFARFIDAVEESNPGYEWDWNENTLKGKLIGLVYGKTGTIIDGRKVVYTEARTPVSVAKIRAGDYKIPAFKAKNGYSETKTTDTDDGFVTLTKAEAEKLPF